MKIFKHIFSIIAAFTLLTACTEELDDFQLSDITITATWEGDHPSYKVEYTNCAPKDITEIGIYETFIDNQWQKTWDNKRIIKLTPNNLTSNDKHWTVYPGDEIEAFAFIKCKNGNFRSEKITIKVPQTEPKITSVSLTCDYDSRFTLVINGEGFKPKGTYSLESTKQKFNDDSNNCNITYNQIKIYGYPVKQTGVIKDILYVDGFAIPFQVTVEGVQFNKVSKTSITIGESIEITVPNISKDNYRNYEWENCYVSNISGDVVTLYPIAKKTGSTWVKLYDYNTDLYNDSVKIDIKCPAWNKVSAISNAYTMGNKLYTMSDDQTITFYDIETGKKGNTYKLNSDIVHQINKIHLEGNKLYVSYGSYAGENYADYIGVLDTSTSKFETLTKTPNWCSRMWLEGNVPMAEINGNIYSLNNNSLKKEVSMSNDDFTYLSKDNGYVYGYAATYTDHENYTFYRYKEGNYSTKEELGTMTETARPIFEFQTRDIKITPLTVVDGYLYYSMHFRKDFVVIYKTKVSSLKTNPETVCLGNVAISNELDERAYEEAEGFYTNGTTYYYVGLDTNYKAMILKSTGK